MFRLLRGEDKWYIVRPNNPTEGPYDLGKITQRIKTGLITIETPVSKDRKNFVRAGDAFANVFAQFPVASSGEALSLDVGDLYTSEPLSTAPLTPSAPLPPLTPMATLASPPPVSFNDQKTPAFAVSMPSPIAPTSSSNGEEIVVDLGEMMARPAAPPPAPAPAPAPANVANFAPAPAQSTVPLAAPISAPLVERYKPGPLKHGDADTCTCPHCMTVFPLEDGLYIARHPDLIGDPFLGGNAPQRFKPTRFTPDGQAIDPGGMPSHEMACPNCHLEVPKCLAEFKPLFVSVIGAPKSGKSYLLATLTWELRRSLNNEFGFAFTDADATMNISLQENEEKLFLPQDPDAYVRLEKTQGEGDQFYNAVNFNGQITLYPKPFIFSLRALDHNPLSQNAQNSGRSIILYDNAGEHFQPGSEQVNAPTTQHMARSDCIFFVFDPTKDPRFRSKVSSTDPQVQPGAELQRQDVILNEVARRVRRYLGLSQRDKYKGLFIVIVGKMDIWGNLLSINLRQPPYVQSQKHAVTGLDVGHVEDVSFSLRALLQQTCPEVVSAAEDFAADVSYMPISAQGHSPTLMDADGNFPTAEDLKPNSPRRKLFFNRIRPADIKPVWVNVPFLYTLARRGMLLAGSSKTPGAESANLVRKAGGLLFCEIPDGSGNPGALLQIPERYAGRTLHHPVTGKPFVVPKPESPTPGV